MPSQDLAELEGAPNPAAQVPIEAEPSGVRETAGHGEDTTSANPKATRARLGTVLGGYRLEEVLGVGGTAAVYRGVRAGGEVAALKVLHAWLNADSRAKKRFLREPVVANRLRHPAIVRMLAEGEDADGTAYLVMEFAEGETVEARRLRSAGRLPLEEVVRLTDELLAVLAVAHAHGVVHRDVKPANLLIAADGHLRVLDFGIARVTELTDASSLITRSGAVLGTVFFMAPEQALGVRDDIDARSDVWAVGATMFTLMTGQFVHRARTVNEAVALAITQPAPRIRSLLPELPHSLAAVIDRALAFNRNNRYADAAAMQVALRLAALDDDTAEPLPTANTMPETATLPERAVPEESRTRAEQKRRTTRPAIVIGAGLLSLLGVGQLAGVFRSEAPAVSNPIADKDTLAATVTSLSSPTPSMTTTAEQLQRPTSDSPQAPTVAPPASTPQRLARSPYAPVTASDAPGLSTKPATPSASPLPSSMASGQGSLQGTPASPAQADPSPALDAGSSTAPPPPSKPEPQSSSGPPVSRREDPADRFE